VETPARYLPGGGTLLGRGDRWLLLARPLDATLVHRLWPLLDDATGLDELAATARRLGSGAACAAVDAATGEQAVDGPATSVAVGDGLLLTLDPALGATRASEVSLPLVGGAVGAVALRLDVVRRRRLLIDGVPDAILRSAPGAPPTEPRGVPLAAAVAAASGHTAPVAGDRPGAAGGLTVGGATRVRQQPDGVHPLQQSTGEMVLAARCVHGHLTDPDQPTCRTCGDAVPAQTPLRVPRPPLGRLVLPDGQQVLLDRSVVLGRRPEAIPGGETWPHLVELPADRTHLSRQHLLVELDGWRVLARDLGSRSGTVLHTPAGGAQRMHAHQAYVVGPGSVLSLADDFAVRVVVELPGDPA